MKWLSDPLEDKEGNQRVIEKFLWFPIKISGEWRWLEKCKILQEIRACDIGGSMEWGKYKRYWINIEWI